MDTLRTILRITDVVDMAFAVFVVAFVARAYWKSRGIRRTTCPLTKQQAVVELDRVHATLAACIGSEASRIARCSLKDAGQQCREECLRSSLLADHVGPSLPAWNEGEPCARCGTTIHGLRARLDPPALLGGDGVSHEWCDLVWQDPSAPSGYKPVCRRCHLDQLALH
jgi:hypothetical protein